MADIGSVYFTLSLNFWPGSVNCTCSKCAIYGQIIKLGAMMGLEVLKYWEHTVLALTLENLIIIVIQWGVNLLMYLLAN